MRLRDDFRDSFDWKGASFTRDGFARWARTMRNPPIRIDLAHKWRPFREGEPVPREMVVAFSEYISDRLKIGDYPLRDIADPCGPPHEAGGKAQRREVNLWGGLGWTGALAFFSRNFSVPEEAFCRDEADIREAARIIMVDVGSSHNRGLSEPEAISHAERIMARTLDEYAELLLRFWKANDAAVMFGTTSDGRRLARMSVCASAPVTEEFYRRFRDGRAEDLDIAEPDLMPESKFLHVNAVAEVRRGDLRRAKASRSVAVTRTVLSQLALLSPLDRVGTELRLFGMAGTPETRKRLSSYNFREVGAETPRTNKLVAEFVPPRSKALGAIYPLALAEYLAMTAIIYLFQAAIKAQRLVDDD